MRDIQGANVRELLEQRRRAMRQLLAWGWTLAAIGRLFGVSRQRVHQIVSGK